MFIPSCVLFAGLPDLCKFAPPYATGGVRVEREGKEKACAVATDGAALVKVEWEDGKWQDRFPDVGVSSQPREGFATTVPQLVWENVGEAFPDDYTNPAMGNALLSEESNDKIVFACTDGKTTTVVTSSAVGGKYPDWRKVVTDAGKGKRVKVNTDRLMRVLEIVSKLSGPTVSLVMPEEEGKPIVIEAEYNGTATTALVMPCE